MEKYFNLLDNIAAAAKAEKAARKAERESARVKRILAEKAWRRAVVGLQWWEVNSIAREWEKRRAS